MDAHPDRHPQRYDVRISDPGEVAASLPHLLGFRPRESVVLVSLTGPGGTRVGLTVRADIPPPPVAPAMAADLTRCAITDDPAGVLVAVASEEPDRAGPGEPGGADGGLDGLPHRALVRELVVALELEGVPVRQALLVRDDRWWDYDCPRPCCAPGAGTSLPRRVTALEVASVVTGMVVERDRGDLAARIARPDPRAGGAMAAACTRAAEACSAGLLETGWDTVAEASFSAVTAALARFGPDTPVTGARLDDDEVARIVWGLRDSEVRDRALELALGPDAAAAERLWTECTRRAPAPLDAAPASLLAVSVWLRGDGAMANVALARALDSEPGYALAVLLTRALAACVGPAELRALIRAAAVGSGSSPGR